jgi:hypothetical protein
LQSSICTKFAKEYVTVCTACIGIEIISYVISRLIQFVRLVSSSIVRRLIVANASTNVQASSSPPTTKPDKLPQIKVALCIQRYVHLAPEMNPLEKDYSNLITELETENSYLSDHELRHKRET